MRRRKRPSSGQPRQRLSQISNQRLSSTPYEVGLPLDARYKVVMIGNSMVGKTSLLRYWRGDPFEPCLMSTVGLDFCNRVYELQSGVRLRLDVWDTAGQERYGPITSVHYRDAKGFIFVYDITDAVSFAQLQRRWLISVDEHVSEAVPIFVVGNKTDLHARRQVTTEEGRAFADSQGASVFLETSAKTGEGVLELFFAVAEAMDRAWSLLERCRETGDPNECVACGHAMHRASFRLRSRTAVGLGKSDCCSAVRKK